MTLEWRQRSCTAPHIRSGQTSICEPHRCGSIVHGDHFATDSFGVTSDIKPREVQIQMAIQHRNDLHPEIRVCIDFRAVSIPLSVAG
jgi:hypothetical protein